MPDYSITEAATVLGVSADTARRLVDSGRLPARRDEAGRRTVAGIDLARLATDLATAPEPGLPTAQSARNRLPGIVTAVEVDGVSAVVELRAGPFRLLSHITRESVEELGLAAGVLATAVVKASSVMVEVGRR